MNPYCLQTHGLTHRFSKAETIINNINLEIPDGAIYGFLGPNGAGKTTTLRLLLGLLKKQQGEVLFFGLPFTQNRIGILQKVGSLIETPSLYAHLTAYENLLLLQKIYRCPKSRIAEVLELVGLSQTGNKKTGQFSLGMKQRLSIAIALLHNPSLLILDEPTNGLDPNGMIEIRELLKKLNREYKITIVISSHLLAEIEKLVTHVGIIHKGEIKFQGTLQQLKDLQQQSTSLLLETDNTTKAQQVINELQLPAVLQNEKIVVSIAEKEKIPALNRALVNHNIAVYELSVVKNDLEHLFMDLINN